MIKVIKSILRPIYRLIKKTIQFWHIKSQTKRLKYLIKNQTKQKIFYLGITEHSNLGDLAQYFCIRNWIKKNYPLIDIYEFEATTVVDTRFNFIEKFSKIFNTDDIIFFQSGYTTQDLGGCHELMHRIVIDKLPNAKIVMMPQTIFFKSEERKRLTSKCYNQNLNLLFLARDRISYELALKMFPDITVIKYPDIVSSLIGHYYFNFKRDKILVCCRNDSEKYYSDEEIIELRQKVENLLPTDMIDTTIKKDYKKIRKKLKDFIENEIKLFSHYKLVITDRFHGAIFSLVANTPVIILKTNDHKVTTSVEWFDKIYDEYVFLADSLEHAFELANRILQKNYSYHLESYFDREYYEKLGKIINDKFKNYDKNPIENDGNM